MRSVADSADYRREKAGLIKQVIRGIYDYPRFSRLLQITLNSDIDQVAHAPALEEQVNAITITPAR